MKVVSITGAKSNVGKSTLAVNVVSWFKRPAAIKCTLPREGETVKTFVTDDPQIIEMPGTDTGAFRKAGADPVIWVHANPEEFIVVLKEALWRVRESKLLVVEGNRALQVIEPDLILFVTTIQQEMKPSALFSLQKAHIIIINIRNTEKDQYEAIQAQQELLRRYNACAEMVIMNLADGCKEQWMHLKCKAYHILEEV